MPGDLLGTLIFTVEQSQEFPLPVGEAGDTGLESRHSRLARFEGRHRRVGQIGEEGLAEHVPVAPPRPPVEEHLVPGGAEGPGKKLSVTAKSRETPPEHETRRLKYVVGLRGIVHKCANKRLNPPLRLREQGQKQLVIGGFWLVFAGHGRGTERETQAITDPYTTAPDHAGLVPNT